MLTYYYYHLPVNIGHTIARCKQGEKEKEKNSLVPPAGRTLDHSLVLQAASINVCSAKGTKYAETEWDARGEERGWSPTWRSAVLWLGPSWGDYGTTSGDQDKSSSFVRLVGHGSRKRAIASNQFCPARASSIISSIIDIDYDFIYLVPPDDQ